MEVLEEIALLIFQLTSFREAEVQKERILKFLEHLIMPGEKN